MTKRRQDNGRSSEQRLPRHVAVIMDGNGRWAQRRGLNRHRGHAEGAESVRAVTRECARLGIEQLTLYAFSTENWKRPAREVSFLMNLLKKFVVNERREIMNNNIRFRTTGRLDRLPKGVREALAETVTMSQDNGGMILRLALNYGGRQELLDAAKALAREARQDDGLDIETLTEEDFRARFYDPEMTDPDLLIRTGGEVRLSNFLLWQLSYAELWFTPACWPAFREPQLHEALAAFGGRERHFGALPPHAQPRMVSAGGPEAL